jgi:integrase
VAQNDLIELPVVRYTRADFTALRAHLNRLPLDRIADLYYGEDDRETLGIQTATALRQRLDDLRDQLVQRACDSMPHLANALRDARKSRIYSRSAVDYLVHAADADSLIPKPHDFLSMWFRPRISGLLKAEGARTIEGLVDLINARGHGWWKPIPRIGQGKAAAMLTWLQKHREIASLLQPSALAPAQPPRTDSLVLDPDAPVLLPFERIALPERLSGVDGRNRNTHRCLISARNDLQAMEAYLYKYRAQPKTFRAYQKELERFLLWCVLKRRIALSDVMFEDCEAHKDFLSSPDAHWIGPRAPRLLENWRPFAGIPSPASQRYAVQAIRSFYGWLVAVRYLSGNPWVTVADPRVEQPIQAMQIDKALPEALWRKLTRPEGVLDLLCATPDDILRDRYRMRGWTAKIAMSAQYRLLRAVLLLLGDSGVRREEAALASRSKLKPLLAAPGLWELEILGKRNKRRTVFLPERAVAALRAHWQDRGLDFDFGMASIPLVSPIAIPPTASSRKKHRRADGQRSEAGFTPDGLGQLISASLLRIADDETVGLDFDERDILRRSGAHAFRHTFGTLAAANEVPLDVLQRALGHTSLNTTTIYVQAEKQRSIAELAKLHALPKMS